MSGGMVKVALYVLIRYGFVISAPAAQPWWGGLLIVAGALSVLIGALRAFLEVELKTVLACSTIEHVGLIAVGLGLALRAKAHGRCRAFRPGAAGRLALRRGAWAVQAAALHRRRAR